MASENPFEAGEVSPEEKLQDDDADDASDCSSLVQLPFDARVYYSFDEFPHMKMLHDSFEEIQEEVSSLEIKELPIFRPRDTWTETIGGAFFEKCSSSFGWIRAWQVNSEEHNAKWLNFGLVHQDKPLRENAKRCPKTMAVFDRIIEKYGNAKAGRPVVRIAGFSLMRPNSFIPPHTDTTGLQYNCMAYHLGLKVPDPAKCVLTVDNIAAREENGKSLIFDATYEHSATNDSDEDRIILYVDFSIDTGKGHSYH